jgi:hypothetical protein
MIDIGKYQDEMVTELPVLSVRDYERIFKIFKASLDNKEFYTYNILKKIEFPEIDSNYIEFYTPNKRMALTIISYNIYEDMKSWWILYLLNKDKFTGAPFYVEGGVQLKYITDALRTSIYDDITNSTIFGGRHY